MIPLFLLIRGAKSLIYKAASPRKVVVDQAQGVLCACICASSPSARMPRKLLAQGVKSLIYKAASARKLSPQAFIAGLEDVRAQARKLLCGGLLRPPQSLRVRAPLLKPKNEMENQTDRRPLDYAARWLLEFEHD